MTTFAQAYTRLNPAQKRAVDTIEGPVMVLAGPGTGKAQVLAMRIAHILQKTDTNPSSILALTFTDSAAKNMRERLVQLIGKTGYYVQVETFHSFCTQVIQQYPEYFPLTHFRLFIQGVGGGVSRGTAVSGIENMHRQGRIRKDGRIVQVPPAWQVLEQDFGRGPKKTVSIGWGDVSTSYHSTGVPNVEVYFAVRPSAINLLRLTRLIGPLLYTRTVRNLLQWVIRWANPHGPSPEKNRNGFNLMSERCGTRITWSAQNCGARKVIVSPR